MLRRCGENVDKNGEELWNKCEEKGIIGGEKGETMGRQGGDKGEKRGRQRGIRKGGDKGVF